LYQPNVTGRILVLRFDPVAINEQAIGPD